MDDGFVIVQAWNCLTPAERRKPLIDQAGNALKHAGVSITVTSVTDVIAFGIGATTVSHHFTIPAAVFSRTVMLSPCVLGATGS